MLFATNNASPTVDELRHRLAAAGIEAAADDIVTSAQAAASMLEPGSTAVVCADGGVLEALAARGVTVVPEGPADAVVVGWTRRFDFDLLASAATAVRLGARLVGTNEDPTHPTPDRLLPGVGGAPGRGGHRRAGAPPRWPASPTTRSWPCCAPGPPTPSAWWGTGPPPTVCWPGAWACPSHWCAPG